MRPGTPHTDAARAAISASMRRNWQLRKAGHSRTVAAALLELERAERHLALLDDDDLATDLDHETLQRGLLALTTLRETFIPSLVVSV
jgi:hypothetical protein